MLESLEYVDDACWLVNFSDMNGTFMELLDWYLQLD